MAAISADDHAVAGRLAAEAGGLLVELRARLAGDGVDARALGRAGDRAAHELLMRRLEELRPDDAVLSEEGPETRVTRGITAGAGSAHPARPARLAAERVWIVDPLDGTREFGEVPRTDWAVHVALVAGGEPVAGAVALPARGLTLSTDRPPSLAPPAAGPARVVVSRSRPPAEAALIVAALGGRLATLGSAGAKAMAVVLGEADVYAHSGGQHEWDSAAPVAVARAAGLHASRLDGSPLVYNRPDPYLPDLLVCRPELAERVIAAVTG